MFIEKEKVEWKNVKYLRQGQTKEYDYMMILNEPLASWDVWDYWEAERVKSMEQKLSKGDILFDVGTESGWCNLVYAQIVGPENMVLVEPSPEFWPNIKALWQKNFGDVVPLGCYAGFFSDVTTSFAGFTKRTFPNCSDGSLIDKQAYRYINDHGNVIPQITIDDYVTMLDVVPDALTIDVEGAEYLVLKGAERTLWRHKPKIWLSEHDDLMLKYNSTPAQIHDLLSLIGYSRQELATNHERHVYYE